MPGVRECPAAPPRAGKFPRGLPAVPGTLGCDALSRSGFPPPSVRAPLSHLLPLGCRCGCDTARAGLAELPGVCLPRLLPAGTGAQIRALPHRRSIAARVSPFPRDPPCPCPAPSPPAGVMLGGLRSSSAGLRSPRVNHPRLGTAGALRAGHPSRVCIWEPVPLVSSPSGLFVPKGDLVFFMNIFQPS